VLIPVPDLRRARRLLCVQPHGDDNDIGAGGVIASLSRAGARVAYLTVSDDLLGVRDPALPPAQARARLRAEQARAGREIGVHAHFWLDYPDAGPWDHWELRRALVRHLRLWRPDFVLAPDPWLPYEAHLDHLRTGRAAAEACLLFGLPRLDSGDPEVDARFAAYALSGVAFYFSARPNTFLDIGTTRACKRRALDAYRTQLDPAERAPIDAALDAREAQWGRRAGAQCGEALLVLHPAHLHCNPDAEEMFGPT
jgi:LmbE family N-acetylglucosaminyl deacetylase